MKRNRTVVTSEDATESPPSIVAEDDGQPSPKRFQQPIQNGWIPRVKVAAPISTHEEIHVHVDWSHITSEANAHPVDANTPGVKFGVEQTSRVHIYVCGRSHADRDLRPAMLLRIGYLREKDTLVMTMIGMNHTTDAPDLPAIE